MPKLTTDGSACTVTSQETGELFAAIPLSVWERLTMYANEAEPCLAECGSHGCRLAKQILLLNREVHKETTDVQAPR